MQQPLHSPNMQPADGYKLHAKILFSAKQINCACLKELTSGDTSGWAKNAKFSAVFNLK